MIWHSPELDEFALILTSMINDGTTTITRSSFILNIDANEELFCSYAWFFVGWL